MRSVLDLARHLSIPVVAEGVENEAVAATLRDLGCDLGQGYLYSKAVRGEELSEWLGAPADAPRLHAVG